MFGNGKQDDQTQTDGQMASEPIQSEPVMGQPFNMTSQAPDLSSTPTPPSEPTSAPVTEDAVVSSEVPSDDNKTETSDSTDNIGAAESTDVALPSVPDPAPDAPAPVDSNASEELTSIKQQALQQLSPLVGHLDQTAEEKFRTTMMMIQAADDQSLIKTAYEAAENIKDEKERAQALLDVINEINYFTQQKKDS
jgi:hypothetical protein